jgi:hypothetical protein
MANELVRTNNQPAELRRGILARIFGAIDHQIEVDKMRSEYELTKMFITLDTQLRRQRRQAQLYLEVTALEDRAVREIVKAQKLEEIQDGIDEIFGHDPLTAAVLKDRVRCIYTNGKPRRRHCRG